MPVETNFEKWLKKAIKRYPILRSNAYRLYDTPDQQVVAACRSAFDAGQHQGNKALAKQIDNSAGNALKQAVLGWFEKYQPTCEESFIQSDYVNQGLPDLGEELLKILVAYKLYDPDKEE